MKPTYMKPKKHSAILNFSNCNRRYSEAPETLQIIPNKNKFSLLSDSLIKHRMIYMTVQRVITKKLTIL